MFALVSGENADCLTYCGGSTAVHFLWWIVVQRGERRERFSTVRADGVSVFLPTGRTDRADGWYIVVFLC